MLSMSKEFPMNFMSSSTQIFKSNPFNIHRVPHNTAPADGRQIRKGGVFQGIRNTLTYGANTEYSRKNALKEECYGNATEL